MALSLQEIERRLKEHFPEAQIRLQSLDNGQNDHVAAEIISTRFTDKTRVQQHKLVYDAIGPDMGDALHALQLTTKAP